MGPVRGTLHSDGWRGEVILRICIATQVRSWSARYGGRIADQLRRMGALLNWEHEVFTLDGPRSDAVIECFVRLFERGLINRCVAHGMPAEDVGSHLRGDHWARGGSFRFCCIVLAAGGNDW